MVNRIVKANAAKANAAAIKLKAKVSAVKANAAVIKPKAKASAVKASAAVNPNLFVN